MIQSLQKHLGIMCVYVGVGADPVVFPMYLITGEYYSEGENQMKWKCTSFLHQINEEKNIFTVCDRYQDFLRILGVTEPDDSICKTVKWRKNRTC